MLESSVAKILWDFSLQTVHNHGSNHPNIVLFAYQQKQIYFIELSCPADINVISKEEEKLLKYVTKFAKRGLIHASDFPTLTKHNFICKQAIKLKFSVLLAQ